jgi:hypothetical protein
MRTRGSRDPQRRHGSLNKRSLLLGVTALVSYCAVAVASRADEKPSAGGSSEPQPSLPTNHQGQSSPQGHPGEIDTHSGGASASSPQGDTPPGMQPVPPNSDKTSGPK